MKKIANFLRLFWGCVFLCGVIINVVLGINSPSAYNKGGEFAWPNFLQNFWADSVVPHMVIYIILFAIIELVLGLLILNKEKLARLGLAGAAIFGIGLLLLGLGAERGNWTARIPNIVFEATILFSLLFNYDKTLLQIVHPKKDLTRTSVIGS
jgi:energy-converting hydrogenase Eha subunit A